MSLPDRFHIAIRNLLDRVRDGSGGWSDITLSSTVSAESAYPLTNVQSQSANKPAQFDMTGETQVVITDSGSPDELRAVNCAAIHNHNCPDGTTIQVELFDAIDQGGTTVYDSGEVATDHNVPLGSSVVGVDPIDGNFEDEGHLKTHRSLWFDSVNCKSYRITIKNTNGFTDDTLRIDKLWIAWAWSPNHGPVLGFGSTLLDDSEHQRKPGGGMETVEFTPRRSLNLTFKGVTGEQRHTFRHWLERAKRGGDLLITMDPNNNQNLRYECTSIYRRTSDIGFINRFYDGHELGLSVEEN